MHHMHGSLRIQQRYGYETYHITPLGDLYWANFEQ